MERTVLHVAIDSFPIEAERLRCPKLAGRPLALAPADSPRPRVLLASREALDAGVVLGTPLLVARRLCRDLVSLPPDRGFYAGIGESILERLAPFAPVIEPGGGGRGETGPASGRFFLDLTGVARTHSEARDRAARVGGEVESFYGLHPTLGVAANKLVSRVAAQLVAPDGDLVDVSAGSEVPFLAPLPVAMIPIAREADVGARLDLLNVRFVHEVQALSLEQLARVFGKAGLLLWRQVRGVDPTPVRPPAARPRVLAEETLARETNDGRVLGAHAARLAATIGQGLRARGEGARSLALRVVYADGAEGHAQRTFPRPLAGGTGLEAAVGALLERAVKRRVRVRRMRLVGWGVAPTGKQLALWEEGMEPEGAPVSGEAPGDRCAATPRARRAASLESALDRVRTRFGGEAVVPASWILHGLALRAPARP